MFGFSFSELVVVVIVALVVIGPKDLPKMLRKAGQWAGKIRRMAADLRAQSGIDDALRTEGLTDDINEIRKLARGELDAVKRAADPSTALSNVSSPSPDLGPYARADHDRDDFYVVRDREYPREGADSYNALPDNAIVYAQGLPKSPLGADPLYVTGDPNGEIPPDPPREFYTGEDDEASPADGAEASDAAASAEGADTLAAADAGGPDTTDASDAETRPVVFGAPPAASRDDADDGEQKKSDELPASEAR